MSSGVSGIHMSTNAKEARFRKQMKALEAHKVEMTKPEDQPQQEQGARAVRDLIKIKLRCRLCGRGRAVYRKFGVCRICLRDMASDGLISGSSQGKLVAQLVTRDASEKRGKGWSATLEKSDPESFRDSIRDKCLDERCGVMSALRLIKLWTLVYCHDDRPCCRHADANSQRELH